MLRTKEQSNLRWMKMAVVGGVLALSTWASPGSALLLDDPPAPDMCDDQNLVGKPDEWNLIKSSDPTHRATVTIIPTLISEEMSDEDPLESALPLLLKGTMRYHYAIYECKDYTDVNSAGFFVYKHTSRFADDQGIWSMGENDPILADTPKRFMYACDTANCEQPADPMIRSVAKEAAELYATRWPNYSTPFGYASLQVRDMSMNFLGDYEVSSDSANIFPTQTFRGCDVTVGVCVTATAQPSFIG